MIKNPHKHWLREMFERASDAKKPPPLYIVKIKPARYKDIPDLEDWMETQRSRLTRSIINSS